MDVLEFLGDIHPQEHAGDMCIHSGVLKRARPGRRSIRKKGFQATPFGDHDHVGQCLIAIDRQGQNRDHRNHGEEGCCEQAGATASEQSSSSERRRLNPAGR